MFRALPYHRARTLQTPHPALHPRSYLTNAAPCLTTARVPSKRRALPYHRARTLQTRALPYDRARTLQTPRPALPPRAYLPNAAPCLTTARVPSKRRALPYHRARTLQTRALPYDHASTLQTPHPALPPRAYLPNAAPCLTTARVPSKRRTL